jgi:antitoxin (DNA-binding transcriptional repressor) of toxin-antitoxin stability system
MKTITIRELHSATGKWVRQAKVLGEVQVTERGRIIAKIVPATAVPERPYFSRRKLTRAFRTANPRLSGGTDSTQIIAEDRDRAIL